MRKKESVPLFQSLHLECGKPGLRNGKGNEALDGFFHHLVQLPGEKWVAISVDYEAYCIAREMGKNLVFLETIEEQIEVLERLSHEKILDFLKQVDRWHVYAQDYLKCYLDGDLENLKSMWGRFPTRHISVIDRRDKILYERMGEYLEKGNALAFVGEPHIRGIRALLRADGYTTHKVGHLRSKKPWASGP